MFGKGLSLYLRKLSVHALVMDIFFGDYAHPSRPDTLLAWLDLDASEEGDMP